LNGAIFHALNDNWQSNQGHIFAGASICDTRGHNVAFPPPPIRQPSVVVIHLLSVSPGGYLKWLKYPQLVALFNLIFFWGSNTQTQCLSGSENFQISRTGGSLVLTSFKDPESMVL
jgi:hypothetical protein